MVNDHSDSEINEMEIANKDIIFCWVHSHIGIRVMKKQNAIKSALDLPCVKVGVPYIDSKHHIS